MAYILYPFIRGLELVGTNVIIVVARISEGSNKWFHSRNSTPTTLQDNTYTFKFNKVLKNMSNQMYKHLLPTTQKFCQIVMTKACKFKP